MDLSKIIIAKILLVSMLTIVTITFIPCYVATYLQNQEINKDIVTGVAFLIISGEIIVLAIISFVIEKFYKTQNTKKDVH